MVGEDSSGQQWAVAVDHLILNRGSPKVGQEDQDAIKQRHLWIIRNCWLYCSCPPSLFTLARFGLCLLLNASLSLCFLLINITLTYHLAFPISFLKNLLKTNHYYYYSQCPLYCYQPQSQSPFSLCVHYIHSLSMWHLALLRALLLFI